MKATHAFYESLPHNTDECVVWPYGVDDDGYPRIQMYGTFRVHRLVCEDAHGPAPSDKHHAAHSCNNRRCVNERHLSWKTPKENHDDRRTNNTWPNGEKNGNSFLNKDEVLRIRELYATGVYSQQSIADEYGVSQVLVSKIVNRKLWTEF